jgi:hypothetical protein
MLLLVCFFGCYFAGNVSFGGGCCYCAGLAAANEVRCGGEGYSALQHLLGE